MNIDKDPNWKALREDLDEMESSWSYTRRILEGSAIARAGHNLKCTIKSLLANRPAATVRKEVMVEAKKRRGLNPKVVEFVIDHAINWPNDGFIATYPIDKFLAWAKADGEP